MQKCSDDTLDKIYERLKESSYFIWQSPQSFGQREVVDWSDVEDIFEEFCED